MANKSRYVLLVSGYRNLLLAIFCLIPLPIIIYLHFFQDPSLKFTAPDFHIFAITTAILLGVFVCVVTWRCYLDTGEVFLRWLTLGFLGFVIVYAPHGFLTVYADTNPWLFLLYGPSSRVVMAACFFMAMLHFNAHDDLPALRSRNRYWITAIGIFLLINILVAIWATSHLRTSQGIRMTMEYCAILLYLVSILIMMFRRISNPLVLLHTIAITWFALSSLSFTWGIMWNHQWWLAHLVFAGGFFILSYGVALAYASTRSFSKVYSQAELLAQLRAEQTRSEAALVNLRHANDQLEKLAATDSLTGIANRREFIQRTEQEMARSIRNEKALSFLLIDLDKFKAINDKFSHQAGDTVLLEFVKQTQTLLRPSDLFARIGGEEFCILLPETDLTQAISIAERLRKSIQQHDIKFDGKKIRVTISIGVVQYHPPHGTVDDLMHRADVLMYQAKKHGRNRVESEVLPDYDTK